MSDFERAYWGDCCNTFDEEQKHYVYARLMGIPGEGYGFNAWGRSVVDIGGGPVSMLLKTKNLGAAKVIDPILWPRWVYDRYQAHGIRAVQRAGEQEIHETGTSLRWDEAWIYNVLQHTDDPRMVLVNARRAARTVRLFEWVDIPPHEGHPQMLTADLLRVWLGTTGGETAVLSESGCHGRAFFGAFPGILDATDETRA